MCVFVAVVFHSDLVCGKLLDDTVRYYLSFLIWGEKKRCVCYVSAQFLTEYSLLSSNKTEVHLHRYRRSADLWG